MGTIALSRLLTALKSALVGRIRHALWILAARRLDAMRPRAPAPLQNALIVASDPGAVVGSRGDDAMFSAVIQAIRQRNPQCAIGVVCVSAPLPEFLSAMGVTAEPVWAGHGYASFLPLLERYDTLIMIGADVMDGHYSSPNALRQWAFSDLAARRGIRAFVLGCSFSQAIAPEVVRALRHVSPRLEVFARERKSKERFDALSAHPATLVADSAFLLPPSATGPDHAATFAWAESQRAQGRFVCALNVHPMIFSNNDMTRVKALNQALADILLRLAQRHRVSILLTPHDFREGGLGDDAALAPLYALLKPVWQEHLLYPATPARASEIKAMVAAADMLITGRMHLGVGALSMGVPMWGLSPQDKFIGLFEHFGLPDLRITPDQAQDVVRLEAFIEDAFSRREAVRDQVRAALPEVKKLAALNFTSLDS